MSRFEVPEVDHSRYSNRQLMGVPLALLLVALAIIGAWFLFTGYPVSPGIEFTGGTELIMQTNAPQDDIVQAFDSEVTSIRSIQSGEDQYIVTFQSAVSEQQARTQLTDETPLDAAFTILSSQTTTPTFGGDTQTTAIYGVVIAFVGMSLVVFGLFRTVVPSLAVSLSAFSDIVVPIALMNLLGIKLTLGTVAALLMLIGYSVDSDILLTNHVLRRSGSFYESVERAMRTGVTMTVTSIAAMVVMAIVSYLFGIQLLTSIGIVLVLGLTTDLVNTYMLNVSLLRWYKYEGIAR